MTQHTSAHAHELHVSIADFYHERIQEMLWKLRWGSRVDILVVVDTEISISPANSFGIRRVIELIRSATVGCMSFTVDVARRDGGAPTIVATPAPYGAKYTGFRFDMKGSDGVTPVLEQYEQVWCFGFKPDNNGGLDSNIDQPYAFPASDSELAALSSWMDTRKGGLFATGDHDYLGASMCHRIPRARTMRRWTNADGVPPIDTADRIDTLRLGTQPLGNFTDQSDVVPQPIQWVPWLTFRQGFRIHSRPHPVLCHPTLGPIDVMPDHAHEGLCVDDPDIQLGGSFDFDNTGKRPEYPAMAWGQPRPTVIAYGSTLAGPPLQFEKGPQPFRPKFPMISVYDGHLANVGRVAVDSTWHHWMDINILEIEAAGGDHWEKIKRYFINLAVWLSPPGYTTKCIWDHLLVTHFSYAGLQEYSPKLSLQALGALARAQLLLTVGPCWITQFLFDHLTEIDPSLRSKLLERYVMPVVPDGPRPDPCLSCPPLELVEDAVLGGIVRAMLEPAAEIRRQLDANRKPKGLTAEFVRKAALEGARAGLVELGKEWRDALQDAREAADALMHA